MINRINIGLIETKAKEIIRDRFDGPKGYFYSKKRNEKIKSDNHSGNLCTDKTRRRKIA